MRKLNKDVYFVCGYYTISLGTGRPEFHPKKPRPDIEYYIKEAGKGVLTQIENPNLIDEGIIGNFMAERYNRQGHLASFLPIIDESLKYKPGTRVECACASGGVALVTGIKSILSNLSDIVLIIGVEVQNTVKAVYGADFLAGAGYYKGERKQGHAHFFPAKFSERAKAYGEKFGKDNIREGMAYWYAQAVEHAKTCEQAQEYHNKNDFETLVQIGKTPPNPKVFLDNLNVYDCSKVSDGGAGILCVSEEGLKKLNIPKEKAVKVIGFSHLEDNLTLPPQDLTKLTTTQEAVKQALENAGIKKENIGILELHDCFTISGILSLEAIGFAEYGKGWEFVKNGNTKREGEIPTNVTGGLIGYGHPTGATGVRQMVDLWKQLTNQAGKSQIKISKNIGMMINMGGNDKTVVSIIVERV